LLDTPGLGDSEGRDGQHIAEMVEKLKERKYVNAFLIVFNS
jgi:predicted GTPase